MFALFAISLLVIATLGSKLLLSGGELSQSLLRRVISRRRRRCELSLVSAIVSLLKLDKTLYQYLSSATKLILDKGLQNVS